MRLPDSQAGRNIPVINGLRGIAASMVCFYHFVCTTTGYIETEWIKDLFWYGKTGVHMFFVISGVVIPLSMIRGNYDYSSWGRFMLKRFSRLEPPYLASLILALIYFSLRAYVPTSAEVDITPGLFDLFLHIGYLVPFFGGDWAIDVYWTLAVEFQYYLILSLLLPLVLKGNIWSRYIFYAIFLLVPHVYNNSAFFPVYAPLFLMGITYAFSITGKISPREHFIVVSLCLISSYFTLHPGFVSAAFITLLIIHFIPYFTRKVLFFLGEISYSLYLVHGITGGALINLLSHKFKLGYQKPIVIIAGYLLSILCSYILYRLVEKPSQKLSSRIKYKTKNVENSELVLEKVSSL